MTAARSNPPTYTTAQLTAMTKAQLLSVAAARGVDGLSDRNTKAEIIASLTGAIT